MIALVVAAAVGLLGGRLCGGRVQHVAQLRLRTWWLVIAALCAQGIVGLLTSSLRPVVIVFACACLAAWCAMNFTVRSALAGMLLLASGILANLIVIAANGGMPVSATALGAAGLGRRLDVTRGLLYKHVAMATHSRLSFLGDRLPLGWFKTVLSAGDLVMLAGIVVTLWAATGPTWRPQLAAFPRRAQLRASHPAPSRSSSEISMSHRDVVSI